MPTFDTSGPVTLSLELNVATVRISATDRRDTVVDVRPTDSRKKSHVEAAEQTRVEFSDGMLLVKSPRRWKAFSFRGNLESIDLDIEVPAGSRLRGNTGMGTIHTSGRLEDCLLKVGMGDIEVDEASAPVELHTGMGDIALGRSAGRVDIKTGSGAVRINRVEGALAVKNANGDTWIGDVTGDVRVSAANGKISVERTAGTVAAKTANGDIRIGEVTGGSVSAHTACGVIDIGILDGLAAWLDLDTSYGEVRNDLDRAIRPGADADSVEVRARTSFGDISIRRTSPRQAVSDQA